ncbi:MAG: hypothetical protein LH606_09295 [Cytophagaceae bacterium]|nr:hypothetical protein [Cytophagaceae bacterium]
MPEKKQYENPQTRRNPIEVPIQLLSLPTDASWLNPIEKLGKYLKKGLIHNHRLAHQMDELQARLGDMLLGFRSGSSALLAYCGLLNPGGIYAESLKRIPAII